MSDFKIADKIRKWNEGGFANNPQDSGRLTVFGIASASWPGWSGWRLVELILSEVSPQPVYGSDQYIKWARLVDRLMKESPALMAAVESFYLENFWNKYRLGEVRVQAVADWIYDHAVNGGARGVKWIQEAVAVEPDGDLGGITLRAINATDPQIVLMKAEIIAAWYRIDKVHEKPSQAQFLNTWLSRDGVAPEIIAQAKAFARDGLDDNEVAQLKEIIRADAQKGVYV